MKSKKYNSLGYSRNWKQLTKFYRTLLATGSLKLSASVSGIASNSLRAYMSPSNETENQLTSFPDRFRRLATRTRARWALGIIKRIQAGQLRGRDGLGLQWLLEQHMPELYHSRELLNDSSASSLIQILQASNNSNLSNPGYKNTGSSQPLQLAAHTKTGQNEPQTPTNKHTKNAGGGVKTLDDLSLMSNNRVYSLDDSEEVAGGTQSRISKSENSGSELQESL